MLFCQIPKNVRADFRLGARRMLEISFRKMLTIIHDCYDKTIKGDLVISQDKKKNTVEEFS